ncbi:MAG: hypothetical protein JWN08_1195 [Frankiales bacterium]|nr:hypothetical protein [Frankiales bacterium]
MRRLLTVFAGLVLLLGLVVPAAVANGGDAPEREDRDTGHRGTAITLYSVETGTVNISPSGEVDPPEDDPDSFAPGARFQAVDLLYSDQARTRKVGRNDISCLVTEVTGNETSGSATLLCQGVVRLDGKGSLAWQGAITFLAAESDEDDPFGTIAITGGTGSFRAAGGQIVLFDQSVDDEQTLNRYEVDLLRLTAKR